MRRIGLFLIVALLVGTAFSAIVSDLQIILPSGTTWYDGLDQELDIEFGNADIVVGELQVFGSADFEYELKNATFQFEAASLIQDVFPTGIPFAQGVFAGGSVLEIYGDLHEKGNVTPLGQGLILQAQVTSATIGLVEFAGNNVTTTADIDLAVTGGALSNGSAGGLMIYDFQMSYLFNSNENPDTGGGVMNFGSSDYVTGLTGGFVEIDAPLPEPLTLLLLSAGSVFFARRR